LLRDTLVARPRGDSPSRGIGRADAASPSDAEEHRAPQRKDPAMKKLIPFLREDDGQDMVEYALLASFISIVAIVALRAIGPLVNTIYQNIRAALS
jgi:Flp pilus assembly pilin Flp